MSPRTKAHLAIITANILFGLNYSYSKSVLGWMSGEALVVARISVSAVMFVVLWLTVVREKVARRDIGMLVLASIFGVGLNQYLFLKGLEMTSPVDASIIATAGPVLVLLFSAMLGRDRITFLKSLGIGIGATGALIVIFYGGMASFSRGNLAGNVIVFLSSLSYACYLIVVKDLIAKYSPITIMAWTFGVSGIILAPALTGKLIATDWGAFTPAAWGMLAFVVIGATCISYVCVARSLKGLSPTTASMYTYSQPVIASMFAIMRGQDHLDWIKIAAALLVFTGVFMVTQSYRFEKSYIDRVPSHRFIVPFPRRRR